MNARTLFICNLLAFVAVVVMNYLSNALPLNGNNPGQLSDMYPNLFVPTGGTFAIWGVIYFLLTIWIGGQVVALFNQSFAARVAPHVQRIGWLFVITCVLNIGWLFAWHWYQVLLSACLMVALFVTLWRLHLRVNGDNGVAVNGFEKYIGQTVFGIYLGWISVALIANMTALFVSRQWSGEPLTHELWTLIMIFIGGLLAEVMVLVRRNIWYGAAVAWAFYGIYLKRSAANDTEIVPMVALGFMVAILIAMAVRTPAWVRGK